LLRREAVRDTHQQPEHAALGHATRREFIGKGREARAEEGAALEAYGFDVFGD
jgi:hypothetical protein